MKDKTKRRVLSFGALMAMFTAVLALLFSFTQLPLRAGAVDDHTQDTALTSQYLQANNYTLTSGDYYLGSNLSVSQQITIAPGATVSLCLNGRTLTYSGQSASSNTHEPFIKVVAASFTLNDCHTSTATDGTTLYEGTLNGNRRGGSVVYAHGAYLDKNTGAVVAEEADELPEGTTVGDCDYVAASFTLNGGNITGGRGTVVYDPYENFAVADAREYNGDDHTRYGYGYGEEGIYLVGGGVYLRDADFTMNGGAIYGNSVSETNVLWEEPTVIRYYRAGEEDINGEKVLYWDGTDENKAYYPDNTGDDNYGVYVDPNNGYKEVTKENAVRMYTFSQDTSVPVSRQQGGGVFVSTSWTYFTTNNAHLPEDVGTAAEELHQSEIVINGGAISNNLAGLHGGGLFIHNSAVTMNGGVIGGAHKYTSSVDGIAMEDDGGNMAHKDVSCDSSASVGGVYTYRGASRAVGNSIIMNNSAEISYNHVVGGSTGGLSLQNNTTMVMNGNVTVQYNTATGGTGGISIATNSTLTMNGGAVQYNSAEGGTGGINVGETTTFIMNSGYVRGNSAGTLGSLQQNGTSGNAGGVNVSKNSTIELNGGVITGNTATGNGGGLNIAGGVTAKITDVVISDNHATGRYYNGRLNGGAGGGIYLSASSSSARATLTLDKVTITGNTSLSHGGGVNAGNYVTADFDNVTVMNNTAGLEGEQTLTGYGYSANGGGLYFGGTGLDLTMDDSTVAGNTATGNGGGIAIWSGTAAAKGSAVIRATSVSGNTVTGYYNTNTGSHSGIVYPAGGSGGGIYLYTYVDLTLGAQNNAAEEVNVTGNTAFAHGGGIYAGTDCTLTVYEGSVSGNSAGRMGESGVYWSGIQGYGGGIYLAAGGASTLGAKGTTENTSVDGNTASSQGGGVYVGAGSTSYAATNNAAVYTMNGGTVNGNIATGYFPTSSDNVDRTSSQSFDEAAQSWRYYNTSWYQSENYKSSGDYTSGTKIRRTLHYLNNFSDGYGGGVYAATRGNATTERGATFTMKGGTITGNTATGTNTGASFNTTHTRGGAVYVGTYAVYQVSGTVTVNGNTTRLAVKANLAGSGQDYVTPALTSAFTEYVSNVQLQIANATAYATIVVTDGFTADNSKIGVGSSSNLANYHGDSIKYITGIANAAPFVSDFTNVETAAGSDFVYLNRTGTPALKDASGDGEEIPKLYTVTLSVTDSLGAASTGATLLGDTIVTSGEENSYTYTVTVQPGYYFIGLYKGEEPVPVVAGASTLTYTLTNPTENVSLRVAVGSLDDVFSITDSTTVEYTGSPVNIQVNYQSNTLRQLFTNTYQVSAQVEYSADGSWITYQTAADSDSFLRSVGVYAMRIVWSANPYVGGTTYYGDWQLTVAQADITGGNFAVEVDTGSFNAVYSGSAITPAVIITYDLLPVDNKNLTAGVDYTLTYASNLDAGTASVTVTGLGNYAGTRTATFVIAKAVNDLAYEGTLTEIVGEPYSGSQQSVALGSVTVDFGDFDVTRDVTIVNRTNPDYSSGTIFAKNAQGGYTFSYIYAGEYVITLTPHETNNYVSGTPTVITVSVAGADSTLGGSNVTFHNSTYAYATEGVQIDVLNDIVRLLTCNVVTMNSAQLSDVKIEVTAGDYAEGIWTLGDAGEYTITVTLPGSENYKEASISFTVLVVEANNSITAGEGVVLTYTYTGSELSLNLSSLLNAENGFKAAFGTVHLASYDALTYQNGVFTFTNAGVYTFALTASASAGQYSAARAEFTIVVLPKAIEKPSVSGETSVVYTGNSVTFALTGVTSGYTLSASEGLQAGAGSTYSATEVGTYTVTASLSDSSNTYWSDETTADVVFTFTIAPISIESGRLELEYETHAWTTAALEPSVTVYISDAPLASSNYSVRYIANDAVGTATVVVTGTGSYGGELSATFAITQVSNAFTSDSTLRDGASFTGNYMGGAQQAVTLGTLVQLYGGTNIRAAIAADPAASAAGATVSSDGLGGYTFVYTNAGTYTLTFTTDATANYSAASIRVSVYVAGLENAIDVSGVEALLENANYTYLAGIQTLDLSSVTAQAGTVTVTTNLGSYDEMTRLFSFTNAGEYVITFRVAATSNYAAAEASITFTVAAATPSYTVPTGLTAQAGSTLSTVSLPTGWYWSTPGQVVSSAQQQYSAYYDIGSSNYVRVTDVMIFVSVQNVAITATEGSEEGATASVNSGYASGVDANSVRFDVSEVKEGTVADRDVVAAVEERAGSRFALNVAAKYDIRLLSTQGSEMLVSAVSADGTLTIRMAVPESLAGSTFYIAHVHDGEVVDVLSEEEGLTVSGGFVTFTVSDLSEFYFVGAGATVASPALLAVFGVLDALLVAGIVIVLVRSARAKKQKA